MQSRSQQQTTKLKAESEPENVCGDPENFRHKGQYAERPRGGPPANYPVWEVMNEFSEEPVPGAVVPNWFNPCSFWPSQLEPDIDAKEHSSVCMVRLSLLSPSARARVNYSPF